MVDTIIKVLQPASSFALMSLAELKTALGIADDDVSQDVQLQQWIDQYSDVIATRCNRVFAREKVTETWRELQSNRVYLSHWPVKEADIELVECPRGSSMTNWELEEGSGKLELFGGQDEPIRVTYTGGFTLPNAAPDALKAACELMVRTARTETTQMATSGIRMIAHKESRVMFYPSSQTTTTTTSSAKGAPMQTIDSLLYHYIRINV